MVGEPERPQVSAVIPTRLRPDLVPRAVRSALAQTQAILEVVVVVDGPDPSTTARLAAIDDRRLRVVALPTAGGPAAARNRGVAAARGDWIAFLDDDDEWLADKLALQLAAAQASAAELPIVSCQVHARTNRGTYVWPKRLPAASEHLSDYLLDRASFFSRAGLILPSTLLVRRSLLLRVPLPDYPVHEDWGWLLDAIREPGARLVFVPRPLAVFTVDDTAPSQSKRTSWRRSLEWIDDYRDRVTPTAYAAFVLTSVARRARQERDWPACGLLLWRACRGGRPRLVHLVMYLATWLLPPAWHLKLRQRGYADAATIGEMP